MTDYTNTITQTNMGQQTTTPTRTYLPKKKKGNKKAAPGDKPIPGWKKDLQAATKLEFGPLQRQLDREKRAQVDREQRITPAYFQQYQADLARIRGDVDAKYGETDQRMLAYHNSAGEQDTAARSAIQERIAADTARRGGTAVPSQQIDVGGAEAFANRANLRTSMAGTLGQQGANAYRYLSERQAIATQQGGEQQEKERLKTGALDDDLRELAARKGAFKTDYMRQKREDNRKYALEQAALNLDAKELKAMNYRARLSAQTSRRNNKRTTATSAANNAADNKATAKQNAKDRRHDRREARKDRKADKRKKD